MFQSKQLKTGGRWDKNLKGFNRIYWTIYDKIEYTWPVKRYRDVKHWFRCLKRWISWRKVIWDNYDFDYTYVFKLLNHKLIRIERCLVNGVAEQDPKDLQAIKICIKLSGKLAEPEYEDRFYRKHDAKWGELETWFEPMLDNKEMSEFKSKRANVITPEQQEQERAEKLAGYALVDKIYERDVKWLFGIMGKYHRHWWE